MMNPPPSSTEEQGVNGRTYCQIAGKEIARQTCVSTQGQEGCFGCASAYRRCENCRSNAVDVPAVGMCSSCLTSALGRVGGLGRPTFAPDFRAACQLLGRDIKAELCEATQGQEGCQGCPARSRLCENCKTRAVRFAAYGLCLTCAVAEYGDGWTPPPVNAEQTRVPWQTGRDERTGRLVLKKTVVVPRPDRVPRKEEPIHMAGAQHAEAIPQAPDAADDPHDDHARDAADEESEDALLTSARALVLARGKASEQLLGKNLHVSYERADALLGQLETEGIVGPKNGRGRREVLPAEQPGGSPPSGGAKPVTLLSQAKALVISRRRSSAAFLQGELGVTPPYAYKLLSLLEAEGVVGPVPSRGQQRQILVDGDGKPTGVPADIRICRKRGCREPVYIKKYGLCAKHASDHYHQQHLNRTEPTEGVKRLLPKAQAVIQKHGRATRALLQKELRVGRPRATEILMTLQHMGLVSPLSANNRRGVAAVSANTSPPKREKRHAKAITKREIHKVEQLIRTIGEESEMGRILRSLVEEARSSQSLRKHLRSVL